jgi:hypothetical protein
METPGPACCLARDFFRRQTALAGSEPEVCEVFGILRHGRLYTLCSAQPLAHGLAHASSGKRDSRERILARFRRVFVKALKPFFLDQELARLLKQPLGANTSAANASRSGA